MKSYMKCVVYLQFRLIQCIGGWSVFIKNTKYFDLEGLSK